MRIRIKTLVYGAWILVLQIGVIKSVLQSFVEASGYYERKAQSKLDYLVPIFIDDNFRETRPEH